MDGMLTQLNTFENIKSVLFPKLNILLCIQAIVVLGMVWTGSLGQNLVPNPSFEEYLVCPATISQLGLARNWYNPSRSTPDYYNACTDSIAISVPSNQLGYQAARTGTGYAGIYLWINPDREPDKIPYREYVQISLKDHLLKGKVYHVEFYVSRAEGTALYPENGGAVANIGAYFSVTAPSSGGYYTLYPVLTLPQVRNRNGMLSDTRNWTKIEGYFVAQGFEWVMTIGNFDADEHTTRLDDKYAYYYIDDVTVELAQCPIMTDLGDDPPMCDDTPFYLDASWPGSDTLSVSYLWQDGSTSPRFQVQTPGDYWVQVRLGDCVFGDTVRVRPLKQFPTDRLKDTSFCSGIFTLNLDARFPQAIGYRWQDGSVTPTYSLNQPGIYWVDIIFNTGCVYRDSMVVTYRDRPRSFPFDIYLCDGKPVTVDISFPGATYQWWDTGNSPVRTFTEPGFYAVRVDFADGCSFFWATQVRAADVPPRLLAEKNLILCPGQYYELDVTGRGEPPYLWQDGSDQSRLRVRAPGWYWIEYGRNCRWRDSVWVGYKTAPPTGLARQLQICRGDTARLDASMARASYYYWNTGISSPSVKVTGPGVYWVDFEYDGCFFRDSVRVSYLPGPVIELESDSVLCYGGQLTLRARSSGQLRWPDGSSGSSFTVGQAGSYWVEAYDMATGCRLRRTIRVRDRECAADLDIPNVITPNGDGKNDYFRIEGITDRWRLDITNSWGQSVYSSQPYQSDWDGQNLPAGVYYYQLYNTVSGQRFRGWLHLLR